MSFSEKLQKLRKENKLSQEQLADMLDVTRQSVSKWESGTTYPEMDKLITMCKIFKCSLDDLTNDEITDIKVENKKSNQFNSVIDNFLEIVEKTINMFRAMNFKQKIKCIISLLILGLFLLLLHIPFDMFESGFYSVLSNLHRPVLTGFICDVFNFILEIVYFVLYILSFIYIYKIAYLNKYEFIKAEGTKTDNTKIIVEQKENVKEIKEIKIVEAIPESSNAFFKTLWKIALGFIKFLVACFTIPLLVIILFLFAAFAIDFYLLFKGVFYLGIFLGIIFAILMSLVVLEVIIDFLFGRNLAFKRLFITFIVSLAGVGISCGILALDISNTVYIDKIPTSVELKTIQKEYDMKDNLYINNDVLNYYHYYSYYTNVDYVPDETIGEKVKIEVVYAKDFTQIEINEFESSIGVLDYKYSEPKLMRKMMSLILKGLQEKTFYDYDKVYEVQVNVYASSKNIEKLRQNALAEEKKREQEQNENTYAYYETQIAELENKIQTLEERNVSLEERNQELLERIEEYKEKINEYKDRINSILTE